jgi:hypothetical protein
MTPDILTCLQEVLEFLEGQADLDDGDYGVQVPNRALTLSSQLQDAIYGLEDRLKKPNRYYNRLRPVGLGTIPKVGWAWVEQPASEAFRPINSDLPISTYRYGVYSTDRPLTADELYAFEINEVT